MTLDGSDRKDKHDYERQATDANRFGYRINGGAGPVWRAFPSLPLYRGGQGGDSPLWHPGGAERRERQGLSGQSANKGLESVSEDREGGRYPLFLGRRFERLDGDFKKSLKSSLHFRYFVVKYKLVLYFYFDFIIFQTLTRRGPLGL